MSVYSPYTKKYQNPNPISEKTISISIAKEEERKIASMGLGELKDFACPKALQHKKDWYITCVSCDGVNTCKPGRRILEILENDTKPEEKVSQIDKFNARISKNKDLMSEKELYTKVLETQDPMAYLMNKYSCTKKAAYNRLYRWKIKYPDIAEKYANVSSYDHSNKIISPTDGRIANNAKNVEEAKKRLADTFTYPDGVYAYYENVKHSALTRSQIRWRIKALVDRYPDMDAPYHISEWLKANRGTPGKRNNGELDKENMIHLKHNNAKPIVKEPEESDEVSVDDFLAEMDGKESVKAEDYGKKLDPEVDADIEAEIEEDNDTTEAEAEIQEKKAEEAGERLWREEALAKKEDRDRQNRIAACLVFSEKRKEIAKNIDEIEMRISQEQKRLSELRDDLLKLDSAAEILGFVVER